MEGTLPAFVTLCWAPGKLCLLRGALLGTWAGFCPGYTDMCPSRQLWSVCAHCFSQVCVPVCWRAQRSKHLASLSPLGLAPGKADGKQGDLIVSSSCLPSYQQPYKLCKIWTLGNKASATAAQLNWNIYSGYLYSFPVLWGSFKGSGEGWAYKSWKDTLLLLKNNTYQNRPNKCDPCCLQPSSKPAAPSHLQIFPSQLYNLTFCRTHPPCFTSSYSLGKSKVSVSQWPTSVGFPEQSPKTEKLVGKNYMPKPTKGAMVDEEARAMSSSPSSWCCFALWPWRIHLLFWCLFFCCE